MRVTPRYVPGHRSAPGSSWQPHAENETRHSGSSLRGTKASRKPGGSQGFTAPGAIPGCRYPAKAPAPGAAEPPRARWPRPPHKPRPLVGVSGRAPGSCCCDERRAPPPPRARPRPAPPRAAPPAPICSRRRGRSCAGCGRRRGGGGWGRSG